MGADWELQPLEGFAEDLEQYQRAFESANRQGLANQQSVTLSFSLHLSNSSAVPGVAHRK